MDSHFLLQGIFPTQGSNLNLPHYGQIIYCQSHQGSPIGRKWKWKSLVSDSLRPMDYAVLGILQARILEWVAFPFSRVSSQPRNRTRVSCTRGRFFASWATREAPIGSKLSVKTDLPRMVHPSPFPPWVLQDSTFLAWVYHQSYRRPQRSVKRWVYLVVLGATKYFTF